MERTFVVYMHTSPTGKRYIGTTHRKPEYRWGVNGKNYSTNRYFWRAIQKYSWDNFKHEILYSGLSKETACRIEQELIAKYRTCDERFGYNLSAGGELSAIGCKRTPEQREKYRVSKLGPKNPQYGKHSWNYGVPCKEETKEKLHIANSGRVSPTKGTHLSEERKQHLHNINIGKIYVNNGIEEICINKCELSQYLDNGYSRGYIVQRSHKNKLKKGK